MRFLAVLLLFSTAAFAKDHTYQPGTFISVSTSDRLIDGTTHSRAVFTVQVDGVVYTVQAGHVNRHTKDISQGLIVGDPVQASVEGNNLFLRKPDGKDLKTDILTRARAAK